MPSSPLRAPADRLTLVGVVLFAVGGLTAVVTVVGFAFGGHDRPLAQNLLAMLAPIGFGLAVVGAVRSGRRDARSNARLYPSAPAVGVTTRPNRGPGRPERGLRVVAGAEAVSWLMLIAATVVKYAADHPVGVQVLGPIHGTLFLAYVALAGLVWDRRRWPLATGLLVLAESVVPGGGFLVARRRELRS